MDNSPDFISNLSRNSTFANVKSENSTATPSMKTEIDSASLSGKRCVITVARPNTSERDSASAIRANSVEAALFDAVKNAGGEPAYITTDEATEAKSLSGCDTLFLCGRATSLRKNDAEEVWRTNVMTTRHVCKAAEDAQVRRIVLLGSILSLGHSADNSAIDAATPYLSDDRRTALEKSLFRHEMEVWQMRERGMSVSVVCGGIPINTGVTEKEGARERWEQRLDPIKYAHFLSTPHSLSEALVVAASGENEGKRLICTGLSDELAHKIKEIENNGRPPLTLRLRDMLGLSQKARACKMLRRAGKYASDFAPASE